MKKKAPLLNISLLVQIGEEIKAPVCSDDSMQIHQEDWIVTLTIQPRPQDFSLKKWVGWERPHPFFKGKALGTRLVNEPLLFLLFSFDLLIRSSIFKT